MRLSIGNPENLVDYTGVITNSCIAQGKGKNLLLLEDKEGGYEFHHLWLDTECTPSCDEAWKTKTGKESLILSPEAGREISKDVKDGGRTLFEFLNLF
jgi:hypothetical protein